MGAVFPRTPFGLIIEVLVEGCWLRKSPGQHRSACEPGMVPHDACFQSRTSYNQHSRRFPRPRLRVAGPADTVNGKRQPVPNKAGVISWCERCNLQTPQGSPCAAPAAVGDSRVRICARPCRLHGGRGGWWRLTGDPSSSDLEKPFEVRGHSSQLLILRRKTQVPVGIGLSSACGQ